MCVIYSCGGMHLPAKRFNRVDFPALGDPAMAITTPDRMHKIMEEMERLTY